MKFPVIITKAGESPIYYFDESEFGLVSKGGKSFYKKGFVYDSEGSKFSIEGIKSVGKASLLKCVRYFQQMYVVDVALNRIGKLTIDEFKDMVMKHVRSHQRYWRMKDDVDSMEESIRRMDSFEAIIKFIR